MSEKCKNEKCLSRIFDEDGQEYGEGGYCFTAQCQAIRSEAAEARAAALEKERDELRAQLEQARKKSTFYHPAFDEGDGSYRP